MMIIDSPFHITFSDRNESPTHACAEKCKSVFWLPGIDKTQNVCKKCSGKTESAVEKVHYKIIKNNNRRLCFKDFKKYINNVSNLETKFIKTLIKNESKIEELSIVKPNFIEKAKKEWC